MACSHPWGGAAATVTLKTDYGTYHLCDECAEAMSVAGYVAVSGSLKSDNPRQRCQCEHENHFQALQNTPASADSADPRRV